MITLEKKYELLREGLFELPEYSYEDISDYVKEVLITKIPADPRIIDLDLSGTKFEFLEKYGPKLKIFFYKDKRSGIAAQFWEYDKEDKEISSDHGNIYINMTTDPGELFNTALEHEILHYIQSMIKTHRNSRTSHIDPEKYGGLPTKKLIPKDISLQGYKIGPSGEYSRNRIKHTKRPIEYYTNLNSAIRELQRFYHDSKSIKKFEDTQEERKRFFKTTLKKVYDGKIKGHLSRIFHDVRKENPELYKKYLKIAYDAFVNKGGNIDYDKIDKYIEDLDIV